ncbi:MAG TPA: hypothetical protein VFT81_02500 [Dermatophilaceae bacterium]|nr:hypothetical protein [Dermatophilaceae bacterium]
MEDITMTMNAAPCVLSVRLRRPTQVISAAAVAQGQGTTVSAFALAARGVAVLGSPVDGDLSVIAPTYKTTDVARFRSGRPPV